MSSIGALETQEKVNYASNIPSFTLPMDFEHSDVLLHKVTNSYILKIKQRSSYHRPGAYINRTQFDWIYNRNSTRDIWNKFLSEEQKAESNLYKLFPMMGSDEKDNNYQEETGTNNLPKSIINISFANDVQINFAVGFAESLTLIGEQMVKCRSLVPN